MSNQSEKTMETDYTEALSDWVQGVLEQHSNKRPTEYSAEHLVGHAMYFSFVQMCATLDDVRKHLAHAGLSAAEFISEQERVTETIKMVPKAFQHGALTKIYNARLENLGYTPSELLLSSVAGMPGVDRPGIAVMLASLHAAMSALRGLPPGTEIVAAIQIELFGLSHLPSEDDWGAAWHAQKGKEGTVFEGDNLLDALDAETIRTLWRTSVMSSDRGLRELYDILKDNPI
jgi:hypothetical protein